MYRRAHGRSGQAWRDEGGSGGSARRRDCAERGCGARLFGARDGRAGRLNPTAAALPSLGGARLHGFMAACLPGCAPRTRATDV
ncbi:hypothetical protein BCEP4_70094 [Burkholderia cepacia]|nr:hypothetical protein BCEP4_70094 [Burkholderia cepacia]